MPQTPSHWKVNARPRLRGQGSIEAPFAWNLADRTSVWVGIGGSIKGKSIKGKRGF
jgi:hypothetical protein